VPNAGVSAADRAEAEGCLEVVSLIDEGQARAQLVREAVEGLLRAPLRELPAKLLYDERGSQLYERITELAEYYPARAEREVLERRAAEIVALADPAELVELGAGSAAKTRALLAAMNARGSLRRYVPLDVAIETLDRAGRALCAEFPGLRVHALAADWEQHLDALPDPFPGSPRLVAFLGGTIGNLKRAARIRLLAHLRETMRDCDRLLVGIDLVKDVSVIERAYNDAAGVTAEFNRNVLRHLNRLLDADFDPDAFAHRAFYDCEKQWVEMRLRALRPVQAKLGRADGRALHLDPGEEIRTETSAKFSEPQFAAELAAAGLVLEASWRDSAELFTVVLARPAGSTAASGRAARAARNKRGA